MPTSEEKTIPTVTITNTRGRSSSGDSSLTLKTPRTARFAEATAVYSPIDGPARSKNPFADPVTNHFAPQPQVADIGFGYLKPTHESVEMEDTDGKYLPPPSPLRSPLKSALKSPGAAPKNLDALRSPTFREEQLLEKAELGTDKEQANDLKAKMRVRTAKFFLRGVNFSCSLIVLSMLSTTFSIFNATKSLPKRNNLPAWAPQTKIWPQILLLSISSVSIVTCAIVFWGYLRGGHRRAEKVAVYYTTFAVFFFIFSIVMWGVGAAVLSQSKANGNGKDIWGWSCKDNNPRRSLFQEDVSYALICRLQNWSLVCCIIEVVIEVLTILVYGIVFYRYYSKRRLRKSMASRDKARSDLYLAQLKSQSAPNTPGFGPLSPREGGWRAPPGHPMFKGANINVAAPTEDEPIQYAVATPRQFAGSKPFSLQPPPIKIQAPTPRSHQDGFESVPMSTASPPPAQTFNAPAPVADGETQYAAVAIPGSYGSPATSPTFAPTHTGQQPTFDFGLDRR